LINGGQTAIDETNALVESANSAAEKVGLNAAGKWYQGGIDVAQKMVDGIQSALDKMTPKLMEKMDAIAAKMKRTVDVSIRVTETVSRIVSTISAGGIPKMAEGGIVSRPTLALIGEAGPEAVVPLSKMGSGGGDVNINVTGGLSTSAEIGQSVVNALRAYSRSAGPLALNIA
jgi:phage-related minor tail protein